VEQFFPFIRAVQFHTENTRFNNNVKFPRSKGVLNPALSLFQVRRRRKLVPSPTFLAGEKTRATSSSCTGSVFHQLEGPSQHHPGIHSPPVVGGATRRPQASCHDALGCLVHCGQIQQRNSRLLKAVADLLCFAPSNPAHDSYSQPHPTIRNVSLCFVPHDHLLEGHIIQDFRRYKHQEQHEIETFLGHTSLLVLPTCREGIRYIAGSASYKAISHRTRGKQLIS
jgi:hypothetical protein